MDPHNLCRSFLRVVDSIPSDCPWGVADIGDQRIFVHDRREESTTIIMEAIASRFGRMIAVESIPSNRADVGPLLGCLVSVTGNPGDAAGELRAAYAIATREDNDDDTGPF